MPFTRLNIAVFAPMPSARVDRRNRGEGRVFSQEPGAITDILQRCLDPTDPPGVLAGLSHTRQRAEFP